MAIELRPVSINDIDLLFRWVNDPNVRANSFQQREVPFEEHRQWFKNKMASSNSKMFIAFDSNLPVGQLRIDIENHIGYISYSVDSLYRGRGIGTQIILAALKIAPPTVWQMVGKVKYDNIASAKAFSKAGFQTELYEENIEFIYNLKR